MKRRKEEREEEEDKKAKMSDSKTRQEQSRLYSKVGPIAVPSATLSPLIRPLVPLTLRSTALMIAN